MQDKLVVAGGKAVIHPKTRNVLKKGSVIDPRDFPRSSLIELVKTKRVRLEHAGPSPEEIEAAKIERMIEEASASEPAKSDEDKKAEAEAASLVDSLLSKPPADPEETPNDLETNPPSHNWDFDPAHLETLETEDLYLMVMDRGGEAPESREVAINLLSRSFVPAQ